MRESHVLSIEGSGSIVLRAEERKDVEERRGKGHASSYPFLLTFAFLLYRASAKRPIPYLAVPDRSGRIGFCSVLLVSKICGRSDSSSAT